MDRLVLADLFHCPAGVEADMLCQVNGGHAAFADLGFDFVGIVEYCRAHFNQLQSQNSRLPAWAKPQTAEYTHA